jgi:hypothetical protein
MNPFPAFLLDGHRRLRGGRLEVEHERYQKLALSGQ